MRARALLCNAYAFMRVRVRTCAREDNWSDLSKKKKKKKKMKQNRNDGRKIVDADLVTITQRSRRLAEKSDKMKYRETRCPL